MMSSPMISVVLPTYNRRKLVVRAVDSVLKQSTSDWELLIVDDGGHDGTSQALQSYLGDPRVHYLYQVNQGPAIARNFGIRNSLGQFLCFLDSDDYFLPQHLELRLREMQQLPEIAVTYGGVMVLGDPYAVCVFDPQRMVDLRKGIAVSSSIFIRKQDLLAVGCFPKLAYSEDGELVRNVSKSGRLSRQSSHKTVIHDRRRGDGLSFQYQRSLRQQRALARGE